MYVPVSLTERVCKASFLPPLGPRETGAFPQSHWGNSPAPCAYHVQGPQWASTGHPGRAVHVRHPPPDTVCVQHSSPGRTPPRSSHLKGLRASFPSLPSSVSATLRSPRLMIPASERHRAVFSAAQANATALSSRVPVQHTPPGGGSHSLCLETRPEPCLAVLATLPLSRVPAAAAQAPYCPGQRPQSTHHWPAQGPAGAHLTHSKGRSRAAAPRPPQRSALPSLPRRPAWQQPWTLPQTFPRDTPAHSAPFSASPVPQDGTLPQMLCVPPVYFVTLTPSPVKAWPSPCGHHVPPAPRAVAGRVNDQLVLPKQMEEKNQTLLGNVISFPHNYVHF